MRGRGVLGGREISRQQSRQEHGDVPGRGELVARVMARLGVQIQGLIAAMSEGR